MTRRIKVYTDGSGPMFCVRLDPPLEGGGTGWKAFGSLPNAMAYARLLRLEFGFLIEDGAVSASATPRAAWNAAKARRAKREADA